MFPNHDIARLINCIGVGFTLPRLCFRGSSFVRAVIGNFEGELCRTLDKEEAACVLK
jgi:hypothetical protein